MPGPAMSPGRPPGGVGAAGGSRGQDRGSRHLAVVTSAGMPFFSELLLGLDGGLDAVDPRATWEVNLLPGSHDGPGLGSVPVRVAGMPQGELACVRVEVEEVAVASPIEQGPLGAGGWLWLTCAGSMALPARTFRVLTPASRRAAKSTDDMSTGSPAGAAQPRRTARSGRNLAFVTRVNGPHKSAIGVPQIRMTMRSCRSSCRRRHAGERISMHSSDARYSALCG